MKVFCILGDERALRTKSPPMFSKVMEKVGLRATYVPFKVRPNQIGQAIESMRVLNVAGANVTVPYKKAVVTHMDVLSEGANIIGAVNTIVFDGNTLKGYNTNAIGIMDALADAAYKAEGKSALIFGTGGAAMAAAFIFNWLRTGTIFITGRNEDKCAGIVDKFGGETLSLEALSEAPLPVHIVVNATSVSSTDESLSMAEMVNRLILPDCELVFDLNYGRKQNFWQEMAVKNEIRFIDGLVPLAFQARRTFALWTGMQVPPEDFIKALEAA